MNNKIKIITCIYDGLFGSDLGGRIGRGGHYRWSLLSILKITNADFICYTSQEEKESLSNFFFNQHSIPQSRLKIEAYNLYENHFKKLFDEYENLNETKTSDRCKPLQYMKFMWFNMEDKSYDNYFWFDAGLSYSGLIPNKYLDCDAGYYGQNFSSKLFSNKLLENLIINSADKFTIIGKENQRNYWSGTVNPKHFIDYNNTIHVIGGLFGGKKEIWEKIVPIFEETVVSVTMEDKRLYHEEDYMTLMFRNNEELFNMLHFDTWWHEDANIPGLDNNEHLKVNKPFYKILEELN